MNNRIFDYIYNERKFNLNNDSVYVLNFKKAESDFLSTLNDNQMEKYNHFKYILNSHLEELFAEDNEYYFHKGLKMGFEIIKYFLDNE